MTTTLSALSPSLSSFSHLPPTLLVTDFEATCWENNQFQLQEIIEFPIHILRREENKLDKNESFHTYVKPSVNPILSEFCTNLTGITQKQVDAAPSLTQVLEKVHSWLHKHRFVLHEKPAKYLPNTVDDMAHWPRNLAQVPFLFVTDGPWDFREFMFNECQKKGIPLPCYFRYWVNLRSAFADFYDTKPAGIKSMLKHLDMEFEGSLHSGFDDSFNIARILQHMIKDGYAPTMNDGLFKRIRQFSHVQRKIAITKPKGHRVRYVGLLWLESVSGKLSRLHRRQLVELGAYQRLMERDPITAIHAVYVNTKTGSVAARFSLQCAFRYRLPNFEDEKVQNSLLKYCGEDPNEITLDSAVQRLEQWARNQNMFEGTRSFGSFSEKPHTNSNCLLVFPDKYSKLMAQLSTAPSEPYLYRVSSFPEFLNNNLGIYPFESPFDINRSTRTVPEKKTPDRERVVSAMQELLKHGALVPKSFVGTNCGDSSK